MSDKRFSLRIISCDYCIGKPVKGLDETYSAFRASSVESVPVIRIFGITPAGQKACLHVHNVFPYLTVPYYGLLGETVNQYMRELAMSIDNSLNIASNKGRQHVFKIQLKMAIPYYGYHEREQAFLKISFYSPYMMKKVIDLLNSGTIMNTVLQPHEAHIPYILQFFIDYNLFGMNYIHTTGVKFRIFPQDANYQPLSSPLILEDKCFNESDNEVLLWNYNNLPINMVLGENVTRQSTCELELDCHEKNIQNQFEESATSGSNPGLAAIWEDEKQRHKEQFDESKITPPASQERVDVKKTTSEEYFLKRFKEKLSQISLTPVSSGNMSINQSLNASCLNTTDTENMEFLEMFDKILEAEDADSILSTQKSDISVDRFQNSSSGEESDDSLEMSQVFWQNDFLRTDPEVDNEEVLHSSGSSSIPLGQIETNNSALSNIEDIIEDAGCSYWLPQLDGAFDLSDQKDSGASTFLELTRKRKNLRKSQNSKQNFRLSKSKVSRQLSDSEKNLNSEEDPPKRVLRKRNVKPWYHIDPTEKTFICPNEILRVLPPKATDTIFSNEIKISNYVNLQHLKKIGTEEVKLKRLSENNKILESQFRGDIEPTQSQNENYPTKPKKKEIKCSTEKSKTVQHLSRLRSHSQYQVSRNSGTFTTSENLLNDISDDNKEITFSNKLVHEGTKTNKNYVKKSGVKIVAKRLEYDSLPFKEVNNVCISDSSTPPENIVGLLSENETEGLNLTLCNHFETGTNTNLPNFNDFKSSTPLSFHHRCISISSKLEEQQDKLINSNSEIMESGSSDYNEPASINDCTFENSYDNTYGQDALFKMSYLSPPTPCSNAVLTPPLAESPTDFNTNMAVPDEDSDGSNDITLFLEDDSSNDSVSSKCEPTNKKALLETSGSKYFDCQSSEEKTSKIKSFISLQPFCDSENTTALEDTLVHESSSAQKEELNTSSQLNTSVYSFENPDVSVSSVEMTVIDAQTDDETTVEYEVLTAPAPPSRKEVEEGGFLVNKNPDSSNKINKQGFSRNPLDLEDFQGTFSGALSKLINNHVNENSASDLEDVIITPVSRPPSYKEVERWCLEHSKNQMKPSDTKLCDLIEVVNSTNSKEKPNFSISNILKTETRKVETHVANESDNTSQKKIHKIPTKKCHNDTFSVIEETTQNSSSLEIPSLREKFDQRKTHLEFITVMSLEVHCQTRQNLKPNPKIDEISAIFYCIQNQSPPLPSLPEMIVQAIVVKKVEDDICTPLSGGSGSKSIFSEGSKSSLKLENLKSLKEIYLNGCDCPERNTLPITSVANERELFDELINVLRRYDPEILVGYEVEMQSWGYVLERASEIDEQLCGNLSRIPKSRGVGATRAKSRMSILVEDLDSDNIPDIKVTGRIVLNVWKIMRKEVPLTSYTFENVHFNVLNKRIPLYDHKTLTEWFISSKLKWNFYEYYVLRVCGCINLLDHFNIVGRTSELARIFGIQFFEVFSRGSQFRVESMMLRMVKARNYIAVSPSIQQRAHSRAPESLPLILEPESKFYTQPVLVLDFQSLYPSIIIAYNYCYSTCLGRVEFLGTNDPFEFGCTSLTIPTTDQKKLENQVTICPLGIAFVKSSVRKGVIPKMLEEILNTRVMVKKSMKENKDNKSVVKLLDARQLGLKLIANVTFGYTAANYSGRMPCVEISDSILSKSRETLQNAINFVENNPKWGAHVVYGDTDSMFVRLSGRTKEQAFKIGEEIAEAVTALNPHPVKLKFEKVYLPCVLQTKKRYVGFMYETLDQKEPVFDAKGIETVRRDGCPAVGKILEKALRILFTTQNIAAVKMYAQRQFQKVMSNRVNIQDLIFAKEYRGIKGYRPTAAVPALVIARRLLRLDPRAEPRAGERVPYVIVYGEPGLPLIKLVKQPGEIVADDSLRLNTQYYVTRVIIPPLERIFCLLGVSISKWLNELPRTIFTNVLKDSTTSLGSKSSLPQYFARINCIVCDRPSDFGFCLSCKNDPQRTILTLGSKLNEWETTLTHLHQICQSCMGIKSQNLCKSYDCPLLYRLMQAQRDGSQSMVVKRKMDMCLDTHYCTS